MEKLSLEGLNRIDVETFKTTEKLPLVVVLDNIRSLHNVGSIFRTADAFLVQQVVLCGITGTPPNKEIHKTALGATETVTWSYEATTLDAIQRLKEEGYTICAIEQTTTSIPIQNWDLKSIPKLAIVLGNEVFGVSDEVLPLVDQAIEIPQLGTKHSFTHF